MPTMPTKLQAVLEAERRGILPPAQQSALDEARRRGLVPDDAAERGARGEVVRLGGDEFSVRPMSWKERREQGPPATHGLGDETFLLPGRAALSLAGKLPAVARARQVSRGVQVRDARGRFAPAGRGTRALAQAMRKPKPTPAREPVISSYRGPAPPARSAGQRRMMGMAIGEGVLDLVPYVGRAAALARMVRGIRAARRIPGAARAAPAARQGIQYGRSQGRRTRGMGR